MTESAFHTHTAAQQQDTPSYDSYVLKQDNSSGTYWYTDSLL